MTNRMKATVSRARPLLACALVAALLVLSTLGAVLAARASERAPRAAETPFCHSLAGNNRPAGTVRQRSRLSVGPVPPLRISSSLVLDTSLCATGQLCTQIYSGTATFVVDISHPQGVGSISNYESVNFVQEVLSQTSTTTRVQIHSIAYLDTTTHFPFASSEVPPAIRGYLQPSYNIQSDHPDIVGLAQQLVLGASTEVQAVEQILDWVLAKISYDYSFSLPNDALSVYRNRSGTCTGFSNLSVALLRAAGIPARRVSGYIPPGHGWGDNKGGSHSWIEVYYLDAGWVFSEPQGSKNFVPVYFILGGCERCGDPATSYRTIVEDYREIELLYAVGSPYTDSVHGAMAAYVPGWDRLPFRLVPAAMTFLVTLDGQGVHRRSLQIQDINACDGLAWFVDDDAAWLTLDPVSTFTDTVTYASVDPQGLSLGGYSGHITATVFGGGAVTDLVVPVRLLIVDRVVQVYLPGVFRSADMG